jgi:UDP-glucose 4-epimerase
MRILVTGGAGFIGSHLVRALFERGHAVCVLDNLSAGCRKNVPDHIPIFEAGVEHRSAVSKIVARERPAMIIHLAAQMNVRRSILDPADDAAVNVLGTLNVLEASCREGVRRVLFASSGGAVYGDQASMPCCERHDPKPTSPYGISKLTAERYGGYFAETSRLEFTALRLANVYGPGQNPDGEAGIVSIFLRDLYLGRIPTIFGDGAQTRDFIWIGDAIDAFVRATEGAPGTYNIGTGRETSVVDLLKAIGKVSGFPSTYHQAAQVRGEVRRNALSWARAREKLGWIPRMTLDEGLERTVNSYVDKNGRSERVAESPPFRTA